MEDLLVRWRAHDPGFENRVRWSRTHIRLTANSNRTACGRQIPEFAYMEDNGPEVPADAPVCARCSRSSLSKVEAA